MMKELKAIVKENKRLTSTLFSLTVELEEQVEIHAGQFLNISTGNSQNLLRRPIAICRHNGRDVTVCYQVVGGGTKSLSEAKTGDELSCVLPLGNGFKLDKDDKKIMLLGGGAGVFPLLSVVEEYTDREFFLYIGFRSASDVVFEDDFKKGGKITVTTDDGTYGIKGFAITPMLEDIEKIQPDVILSCGPAPMMRALKNAVDGKNIKTFVSLEQRMACGIGACLVCTCKKSDGSNARVCKDGPVFNINEVEL